MPTLGRWVMGSLGSTLRHPTPIKSLASIFRPLNAIHANHVDVAHFPSRPRLRFAVPMDKDERISFHRGSDSFRVISGPLPAEEICHARRIAAPGGQR